MKFSLKDLLDVHLLEDLLEKFNSLYSFPSAVVDKKGKTLASAGWQKNQTFNSDDQIMEPDDQNGLFPGLEKTSTPITIEGRHLGNLITIKWIDSKEKAFGLSAENDTEISESLSLEAEKESCQTGDKQAQHLLYILGMIESVACQTLRELKEQRNRTDEKELAERYHVLLQSTYDWIWEIDAEGRYSFCSDKVEAILGYSPKEIIGKTPFDLMDEEKLPMVLETFNHIKSNKLPIVDLENWCLHKNGTPVCLLTNGFPMFDSSGEVIGYRGADKDISDRKLAEKKIRESEINLTAQREAEKQLKLLKRAVEQSTVGILITDKEGFIEYCNPHFSELTGYSLSEVKGLSPDILKSGFHDEVFYRTMWSALKAGNNWQGEFCNKKKNGEIYWESDIISPILDDTGNVSYFVAIKEDITARKRILDDLNRSLARAEESDRLKSAFLANMSHEIRTPMNGIMGFADLLKTPGLTGDEKNEYISIIKKSGTRMLNIINDIVDVSKIESGLMNVHFSETHINEKIDYVHNFFKIEADRKGIQLLAKTGLPSYQAIIQSDGEKIYAILMNLVKNAIKFTPSGSIEFGYTVVEKIHEFSQTQKIHENSQTQNIHENSQTQKIHEFSLLQFYVKDTGIGIPKSKQEVIFERFVQVETEERRPNQGAGLGLAISKAYVDMLGGKIWVESDPEGSPVKKGSTFYFTIPYVASFSENSGNRKGETRKQHPVNPLQLKILIVEDETLSSLLLKNVLKNLTREILYAATGDEAIQLCRNHPDIDLILMDIRLPGMNGYEVTKQIRLENREVVIIAQTAFGLTGDKEKAMEAGCNDYIPKPLDRTALRGIIKKYLTEKAGSP